MFKSIRRPYQLNEDAVSKLPPDTTRNSAVPTLRIYFICIKFNHNFGYKFYKIWFIYVTRTHVNNMHVGRSRLKRISKYMQINTHKHNIAADITLTIANRFAVTLKGRFPPSSIISEKIFFVSRFSLNNKQKIAMPLVHCTINISLFVTHQGKHLACRKRTNTARYLK